MKTEEKLCGPDRIPDSIVKKATNIITDSKKAVLIGLIPILCLAYIGRVAEWYLLKSKCPLLGTDDCEIAKNFRSALPSLWFGALCWPIIALILVLYLRFS